MVSIKVVFVIIFFTLAIFFSAINVTSLPFHSIDPLQPASVQWWCHRTPYPKTCIAATLRHRSWAPPEPIEAAQIVRECVEAAIDEVESSRQYAAIFLTWRRQRNHNHHHHHHRRRRRLNYRRERGALSDCLKLHDATIRQLNRTAVDRAADASLTRTWLSAALTNLDTCLVGLAEIRSRDLGNISQFLNRGTELIKILLAITKMFYETTVPSSRREHDGDHVIMHKLDHPSVGKSKIDENLYLVVAQDGSGNFRKVSDAINEASERKRLGGSKRFVIFVKAGVYKEHLEVGFELQNLTMIGDGIGKTVITGSRSVVGGFSTFNSATFTVAGEGFVARDITFRNTAGRSKKQAVAVLCEGDLATFYRCSFEGYQDTLYAHSQRQFYRECDIYGTVDFIFGNAAAVFQGCRIFVRRPLIWQQKGVITAQGRTDPNQATGFSIQNCTITSVADLTTARSKSPFEAFLGRPWMEFSRTVYMQSYMGRVVAKDGWVEWDGEFALNTLFYGEYANTGPGSNTSERVKWQGYHVMKAAKTAAQFTVGELIGGSWLPDAGVPFNYGL